MLDIWYPMLFPGDLLCFSQALASQVSLPMSPHAMEQQRRFQEKADEAGVVIFVMSKAFAISKISQQQVHLGKLSI